MKQINGKVISFENEYYYVKIEDSTRVIPIKYETMHKYVQFDVDMMENNHLKIGTNIRLIQKDNGICYPDHTAYNHKQQKFNQPQNISKCNNLLENVPEFTENVDFDSFVNRLADLMPSIRNDKIKKILNILASEALSKSEKVNQILKHVHIPIVPVESKMVERKSSLFHPADGIEPANDPNKQMKEITETIASLANANTTDPRIVIVGVNDDGSICGIQREIAERYPKMNLDQFQNTFLVNFIRNYTGRNDTFMSSLDFNWYQHDRKLILVITINYVGLNPVICDGKIIPYRTGSSKSKVTGNDMVDFIRNFKRSNAS